MIRKPIIVADAMRANSFLSGLVHFFTKCMLSFTNCLKGWTITALTSDIVAECKRSGETRRAELASRRRALRCVQLFWRANAALGTSSVTSSLLNSAAAAIS